MGSYGSNLQASRSLPLVPHESILQVEPSCGVMSQVLCWNPLLVQNLFEYLYVTLGADSNDERQTSDQPKVAGKGVKDRLTNHKFVLS